MPGRVEMGLLARRPPAAGLVQGRGEQAVVLTGGGRPDVAHGQRRVAERAAHRGPLGLRQRRRRDGRRCEPRPYRRPRPAGGAHRLPTVVVGRDAGQADHGVHRGRSAHAAPGAGSPGALASPSAGPGARATRGRGRPHVEQVRAGQRGRCGFRIGPGLDEQDGPLRVLAEPGGHDGSCGARPHDYDVVAHGWVVGAHRGAVLAQDWAVVDGCSYGMCRPGQRRDVSVSSPSRWAASL